MRKIVFLFMSLFFLALSEGSAAGRYGGELYLSINSDPKSFNPIVAQETSTTEITSFLFDGLTTLDGETGEVKPNLALNWQISDDGKTVVFNLRSGVKWFDGVPFTADDVVFTFNQLIYNPDIVNSAADIFTVNGKQFVVEKIAPLKVKFILPTAFAPFLRSMSQAILPKHVLLPSVTNKTFNSCWGVDALVQSIVGTGPFMLEKYEAGSRVILTKNPLYWKRDDQGNALPFLSKIIFSVVKNEDVALLKFKEHKLDYYAMRGLDFPILKPQEQKSDFTIYRVGPALGSNFLSFNLNEAISPKTKKSFANLKKLKWFKNKAFRKAVAYSIDRESIINIVYNGLGYLQYSSVPESIRLFYNEQVTKYEYDPKKAMALLSDAGFVDRNKDGVLEDAEGNDIVFNLFVNANSKISLQMAELIVADLKKIKMNVNLVSLEFNALVVKLTSSYDWDMVLLGFSGVIDPHFGANVWLSTGTLHFWYPKQQKPNTVWEKRVDAIFTEAVSELDPLKRKQLYDEWQQLVSDNLPLIYLCIPETTMAIRNKFGNLHPTSLGGAFHNIEEIYVLEKFKGES